MLRFLHLVIETAGSKLGCFADNLSLAAGALVLRAFCLVDSSFFNIMATLIYA